MSSLPLIDYESLLDEKRAGLRPLCGQVVALAVMFVPLMLI